MGKTEPVVKSTAAPAEKPVQDTHPKPHGNETENKDADEGSKAPHGKTPDHDASPKASVIKSLHILLLGTKASAHGKEHDTSVNHSHKELAVLSNIQGDTHLKELRGKSCGKITKQDVFCYVDGEDEAESVPVATYLELAGQFEKGKQNDTSGHTGQSKTPEVIYVKRLDAPDKKGDTAHDKAPSSAEHNANDRSGNDKSGKARSGDDKSGNVESGDGSSKDVDQSNGRSIDPSQLGVGALDEVKHASQLTGAEWDIVLENCGAMYGWYVDRKTNRIEQAPMPAFRLRREKKKQPTVVKNQATSAAADSQSSSNDGNANPDESNDSSPGKDQGTESVDDEAHSTEQEETPHKSEDSPVKDAHSSNTPASTSSDTSQT